MIQTPTLTKLLAGRAACARLLGLALADVTLRRISGSVASLDIYTRLGEFYVKLDAEIVRRGGDTWPPLQAMFSYEQDAEICDLRDMEQEAVRVKADDDPAAGLRFLHRTLGRGIAITRAIIDTYDGLNGMQVDGLDDIDAGSNLFDVEGFRTSILNLRKMQREIERTLAADEEGEEWKRE